VNWLGAGLASFFAAVVGALVGALTYTTLRRSGVDFPPIVGLLAGLAAALASGEKSGMRGVLVGSLGIWASAMAEVFASPSHGIVSDLAGFHERLGLVNGLAYAACGAVAAFVGSLSLRDGPRPVEAPLRIRSSLPSSSPPSTPLRRGRSGGLVARYFARAASRE
jgi:hypothetical protein